MTTFTDWEEVDFKYKGENLTVYWHKIYLCPIFEIKLNDTSSCASYKPPIEVSEAVNLWMGSGFKESIPLQEFISKVLDET